MNTLVDVTTRLSDPHYADALVAALRDFADRHGLLKFYREDLEVHDRRVFGQLAGWLDWVWVAGESFSHLYPVGLHVQLHEYARAALRIRDLGVRKVCRLKPLEPDPIQVCDRGWEAMMEDILGIACYRRVDTCIVGPEGGRFGTLMMHYELDTLRGVYTGLYHYESDCSGQVLPDGWVTQFALAEACQAKGLFTRVRKQSHLAAR